MKLKTSYYVSGDINFPKSSPMHQLTQLDKVAIVTSQVAVDITGSYNNNNTSYVTIEKFKPTFKLANGINLPKIVECIGSDGVARRQLVKGKDDLRQDAVMQQVFGMVNSLLEKDVQAKTRALRIRQYKVWAVFASVSVSSN